jgi:hypothetical protein
MEHPFQTVWQQTSDWFTAPLTPISPWTLAVSVAVVLGAIILWGFALNHMIAAVETL